MQVVHSWLNDELITCSLYVWPSISKHKASFEDPLLFIILEKWLEDICQEARKSIEPLANCPFVTGGFLLCRMLPASPFADNSEGAWH